MFLLDVYCGSKRLHVSAGSGHVGQTDYMFQPVVAMWVKGTTCFGRQWPCGSKRLHVSAGSGHVGQRDYMFRPVVTMWVKDTTCFGR